MPDTILLKERTTSSLGQISFSLVMPTNWATAGNSDRLCGKGKPNLSAHSSARFSPVGNIVLLAPAPKNGVQFPPSIFSNRSDQSCSLSVVSVPSVLAEAAVRCAFSPTNSFPSDVAGIVFAIANPHFLLAARRLTHLIDFYRGDGLTACVHGRQPSAKGGQHLSVSMKRHQSVPRVLSLSNLRASPSRNRQADSNNDYCTRHPILVKSLHSARLTTPTGYVPRSNG